MPLVSSHYFGLQSDALEDVELNKHEWARRIARTANVLITISIFLVMVWWGASLVLFGTCGVLYCAAWWMEGGVGDKATTPSEAGLTSPFRLHR